MEEYNPVLNYDGVPFVPRSRRESKRITKKLRRAALVPRKWSFKKTHIRFDEWSARVIYTRGHRDCCKVENIRSPTVNNC